jgi:hypothetical protein
MAERPTSSWREGIEEERRELAAGTLGPECACMAALERVVSVMNAINEERGGSAYETDEREQLCD